MKKMSLESMFGDEKIDIDCPACSHNFSAKFKEVMGDKHIIKCPGCGQDIEINHDDTTKKTLTDSNKALGELDESLKKLERTFKKFGR